MPLVGKCAPLHDRCACLAGLVDILTDQRAIWGLRSFALVEAKKRGLASGGGDSGFRPATSTHSGGMQIIDAAKLISYLRNAHRGDLTEVTESQYVVASLVRGSPFSVRLRVAEIKAGLVGAAAGRTQGRLVSLAQVVWLWSSAGCTRPDSPVRRN